MPRYFCHKPIHDGLSTKEKKIVLYFNDKEIAEKDDVDNSIEDLTTKINDSESG